MHDRISYQVLKRGAEPVELLTVELDLSALDLEANFAVRLSSYLPDQMP